MIPALLACFLCACLHFASIQDVWIDETTQLSGIRLPFIDNVKWLAGHDAQRFGVPGDRMPPLAYFFDHLWWKCFGNSILGFRFYHIVLATIGLALIAREEIHAFGRKYIGFGIAAIVFSPKILEASVELRPYSLFFATTCVILALFNGLIKTDIRPIPWLKLLMFATGCLVLCYIHFFGVIAAYSYYLTLIFVFIRDRSSTFRILAVGSVLAACLCGLYPFIFGAELISQSETSVIPGDLVHYALLLIGHSSLMIYPALAIIFYLAGAALLVAGASGAIIRIKNGQAKRLDWLVFVAGIGAISTIVPSIVVTSFNCLKPSYSIWLLPNLILIMAIGASDRCGWQAWDRFGRILASIALLVAAAASTVVFLVNAQWFVHGPARAIERELSAARAPAAIIYVNPDSYAYGYFPMVYLHHNAMPQWLTEPFGITRLPDASSGQIKPLDALGSYRSLIIVDTRPRQYTDLRDCLAGNCPDFAPPELGHALAETGRWTVASNTRSFGIYDTVITRLTAHDRPGI